MNDADIEMMLASLSVQYNHLEKALAKATGIFDKQTLRIERRAANMTKQVNAQFSKVKNAVMGTAAVYGVERLISSVVDYGSKLRDTSDATKLSTKFLQEQGIMAGRAGVEQDALNASMVTFAKNVGLAQMGNAKAKKMFDAIGVNVSGAPEDVYYRVADAVAAAASEEQKLSIVTKLLDNAGLVPIMEQGSEAIRRQAAEFEKLGMVLSDKTIDEFDKAGDAWSDLKKQMMGQVEAPIVMGILDGVSGLSGEIGSPEFKSNMKEFGERLGEIAKWVIKIAPYLPAIAAAWVGAKIPGPPIIKAGAATVAGYAAYSKMNAPEKTLPELMKNEGVAKAELDSMRQAWDPKTGAMRSVDWNRSGQAKIDAAEQAFNEAHAAVVERRKAIAAAALAGGQQQGGGGVSPGTRTYNLNAEEEGQKAAALAQKRSEVLARTAKDAEDANADLVKASREADVERLRGTDAYYTAVQQSIDASADAEIAAVMAKRDAQLNSIKDMEQGWKGYAQATANINGQADSEIGAINARRTAELSSAASDIQERTKELKDHVAVLGMTQEAAERYQVTQQSEAVAAALEAAGHKEAAAALREKLAVYLEWSKGAEEAGQSTARAVSEADALRDALSGIANQNPFEQVVEQLKQAIIQLEIIDPLIEKLLGRKGTTLQSGGGMLGGMFGSSGTIGGALMDLIPGFANGTPSAPGGLSLVGENGPELLNIPRGSQVFPKGQTASMLRGGGQNVNLSLSSGGVVVNGNADGATVGMLKSALDQQEKVLLAKLPKLLYVAQRDNF